MAASAKRILAIHAHPDDVEFQFAGTLLLLKERGCRITIATMTPGDCGTAEMDANAIAETRRAEARKSANILGAEYHCLEFRDLQIVHDNPTRKRVTEFIRRTNPDIVFTSGLLTTAEGSCNGGTANYFLADQAVNLANGTVAGCPTQRASLGAPGIPGQGTFASLSLDTNSTLCAPGYSCFGGTVLASVNNGNVLDNNGFITWTIRWASTEYTHKPKGVLHYHTATDTPEVITFNNGSLCSRDSRMKNSITAMSFPCDKIGIPTPVFKPAVRAAVDRGKLGSLVTSSTQADCFDFHTRPGSPTLLSK